jgi:hypothetical protein
MKLSKHLIFRKRELPFLHQCSVRIHARFRFFFNSYIVNLFDVLLLLITDVAYRWLGFAAISVVGG